MKFLKLAFIVLTITLLFTVAESFKARSRHGKVLRNKGSSSEELKGFLEGLEVDKNDISSQQTDKNQVNKVQNPPTEIDENIKALKNLFKDLKEDKEIEKRCNLLNDLSKEIATRPMPGKERVKTFGQKLVEEYNTELKDPKKYPNVSKVEIFVKGFMVRKVSSLITSLFSSLKLKTSPKISYKIMLVASAILELLDTKKTDLAIEMTTYLVCKKINIKLVESIEALNNSEEEKKQFILGKFLGVIFNFFGGIVYTIDNTKVETVYSKLADIKFDQKTYPEELKEFLGLIKELYEKEGENFKKFSEKSYEQSPGPKKKKSHRGW